MEVPKRHSSPSWDDRPLKSLPQRPSNSTLAKASRQPAPAHSFSPSTSSTATLDNSVTNALNFAIFENDRMLMDSRTSSPSQASPNHFPKHHREPPSLDSQANLEDLNRKLEAMQARIHTMERTAADEKTQHLTDRVRDLQQVFSVAQPVIQPTYIAPSTFQPGVPYLVNPQPIHPQAVYYSPPPEYSNNGSYYGGGPSQPWPNHPQGYPPNAPQYAPQSHPIYYPSHHPQSHPIGYQPPHQSYPMGPQPHMPPQPPPQFQPHLPPQLPPQFQSPGRFQPLRSQPPHRAPPTHPRDMGRNAHYPQEGRKDGPRQPGNGRFPWGETIPYQLLYLVGRVTWARSAAQTTQIMLCMSDKSAV
ncbi:hypothetical protein BD779DRAFT_1190038 [Infundibulicybe gibba]|nr:hypothetical protein BD779DRAFT_1190038 [Infundibulicybe gibba]